MNSQQLLLERKGNVCTLTLNRPEKKNSLSPDLIQAILEHLQILAADAEVRVLVIRGFGSEAFCSGYDIKSLPNRQSADFNEEMKALNPVESVFQAIVNFPYPVIAMVNGFAFGAGCELTICCDLRVAADDIRMGMPPAKLGIVYPWSGLQRFIQVLGLGSTKEMFFTGRFYRGERLREIGLIDYLVPRSELETFTYGLAEEIGANAPLALKGTKRVLNLLMKASQPAQSDIAEAQSLAEQSFLSEDLKEGQQAFIEKRKPKFSGK